MRPNKVEIAVQCFHMSRTIGFSGHGNSIYNVIPLLKKENVHLFLSNTNNFPTDLFDP